MTQNQQRRLYFPAWTQAFKANWTSDRGRIQDAVGYTPSEWRDRVVAAADVRAREHVRGITQDDLRHACHVVAFGRDRSSTDLRPLQMRRVLHLFRLLVDPQDLTAIMRWMDPRVDEREEAVWFLENKCREAYVRHIAHDLYGTKDWEGLPDGRVIALANTLRARRNGLNHAEPLPRVPTAPQAAQAAADDEDEFTALAAEMLADQR